MSKDISVNFQTDSRTIPHNFHDNSSKMQSSGGLDSKVQLIRFCLGFPWIFAVSLLNWNRNVGGFASWSGTLRNQYGKGLFDMWWSAEVLCNLAIGSYCIFSKLVTFISSGYVFIQFHCFWPIWGLHRLERVADPMVPGERQHARCQRLRSRLHQVCEALHEVGWFYEGRTKGPSWPSAGFPIAIYRRQGTETGQIIVEL